MNFNKCKLVQLINLSWQNTKKNKFFTFQLSMKVILSHPPKGLNTTHSQQNIKGNITHEMTPWANVFPSANIICQCKQNNQNAHTHTPMINVPILHQGSERIPLERLRSNQIHTFLHQDASLFSHACRTIIYGTDLLLCAVYYITYLKM